jgi:hypothetical protein
MDFAFRFDLALSHDVKSFLVWERGAPATAGKTPALHAIDWLKPSCGAPVEARACPPREIYCVVRIPLQGGGAYVFRARRSLADRDQAHRDAPPINRSAGRFPGAADHTGVCTPSGSRRGGNNPPPGHRALSDVAAASFPPRNPVVATSPY